MSDNPQPTHCNTCDRVDPRTRKLDGWRWRCLSFPVPDVPHFLGDGIRGSHPYGRCMDRNTTGQCPDWTPTRDKFQAFEEVFAHV